MKQNYLQLMQFVLYIVSFKGFKKWTSEGFVITS